MLSSSFAQSCRRLEEGMICQSTSRTAHRHISPQIAETTLLELFAPTRREPIAAEVQHLGEHTDLWRADAVHRAKNMAQMAVSLANVAENSSRSWLPSDVISQARRLSRAYDALVVDEAITCLVPCAMLLHEIISRLVEVFGAARQIRARIDAEPLFLTPATRRALVLIGSELTINALKYGYPMSRPGVIAVRLEKMPCGFCLTVEDDGVGANPEHFTGRGSALITDLAAVLGATLSRSPGAGGNGVRATLSA
jgi:two-component sensor histidine kinase